jgi:hypothetical protein
MTIDHEAPGEQPVAGHARANAADDHADAPGHPVAAELPSGSPIEAMQAALNLIPPQQQLPLPRWLAPLALSCFLGIIPWIVYLALTLPADQRTDDYDVAWVGFDCMMCLVLAFLAYCALRRKPATELVAAVAATMLVIDAWFDVVTTRPGTQLMFAVFSAVFAEIPLAIICGWVAVNAERVRARAYRRLRLRWERAVEMARTASDEPDAAAGTAG